MKGSWRLCYWPDVLALHQNAPWMPTNPMAEARSIYSCIHTTSPYTFLLRGLTQFKATITAAPHMLILHWTRAH